MMEKIKCRVCGCEWTAPPDCCPRCFTKPESTSIYTDEYLAGLIDGEGSFSVSVYWDEKAKRWYLVHDFTMQLSATKEWIDIADHLEATYGGSTKFYDKEFYMYRLRRAEDYLRFLDHFIPHLKIRRSDAEKVRKSLIAYKAIPFDQKGRATKEEWDEWLERYKLRELPPPPRALGR